MKTKCNGLFGLIFGHKFTSRHSEERKYPEGTIQAMKANLDICLDPKSAVVMGVFDAVNTICEGYRDMDEVKETYTHDICLRCGQVVRPEAPEAPETPEPIRSSPSNLDSEHCERLRLALWREHISGVPRHDSWREYLTAFPTYTDHCACLFCKEVRSGFDGYLVSGLRPATGTCVRHIDRAK